MLNDTLVSWKQTLFLNVTLEVMDIDPSFFNYKLRLSFLFTWYPHTQCTVILTSHTEPNFFLRHQWFLLSQSEEKEKEPAKAENRTVCKFSIALGEESLMSEEDWLRLISYSYWKFVNVRALLSLHFFRRFLYKCVCVSLIGRLFFSNVVNTQTLKENTCYSLLLLMLYIISLVSSYILLSEFFVIKSETVFSLTSTFGFAPNFLLLFSTFEYPSLHLPPIFMVTCAYVIDRFSNIS